MGIELRCKDDFDWYKKRLDVDRKYNHAHYGQPEKYPCQVSSNWYDDPNGPYSYDHTFIYQQEVVCECCGHKTIVWPEVDA